MDNILALRYVNRLMRTKSNVFAELVKGLLPYLRRSANISDSGVPAGDVDKGGTIAVSQCE